MMRWMGILSWSRSLPRDLRLLFFSLFLWTFGLGIYNYVWSLYLTQLNANPEQVGLVSSIGFFAAAISMIPGGILANKYDNRILLIIGWAMSIPVPILFYFSRAWSDVIPGLILLQLSAFNVPAMNAFISALGDQKRMSSAFGAVYSAFPLGLVLSPAVGSLLLTWLSIRDLFWFTLALWTVSTIILFPLTRQPPREVDSKAPLLELPRSSRELTILVFLLGGARAPSNVAYSLLSNMREGKSRAGQVGFYLTFEQLGLVVGSFIGGFLYASNHTSVLITTSALLILLPALAGFRIRRGAATGEVHSK